MQFDSNVTSYIHKKRRSRMKHIVCSLYCLIKGSGRQQIGTVKVQGTYKRAQKDFIPINNRFIHLGSCRQFGKKTFGEAVHPKTPHAQYLEGHQQAFEGGKPSDHHH
jgi:hypothetical protein